MFVEFIAREMGDGVQTCMSFYFRNSREMSWDPHSPERTVIFLPDSSHSHVKRSSPGTQSLHLHNGVGNIRLSSHSIKARWACGSKWIKNKRPSIDHEDSEPMRVQRYWGLLGSDLPCGNLNPSKDTSEAPGTWFCLTNELDLNQRWHTPKCWEENRKWNCRTLATTRHLSLEITPKVKKCQAAHSSRLPVNSRPPDRTLKNSGFWVRERQSMTRGMRSLQRETCLPDLGGFFEEEWCLDENEPKDVII